MRPASVAPEHSAEPRDDLTPEQVETWVRQNAAPGGIVVVMQAQRQVREYFLDEIESLNLDKRRLTLTRYGRFSLAGRSLDVPKNALMLCVPTADMIAAATTGRTWLNGRLAYRRLLSLQEKRLAGLFVGPRTILS